MKSGLRKGFLLVCMCIFAIFVLSGCGNSDTAGRQSGSTAAGSVAAGEKKLKGVWEFGSGLVTVVFRDNGEYFAFNTFPEPWGYRETNRYTDDGQSFTLYFKDKDDPSIEQREQYTYTIENSGDRLVIISQTDSRYVNGQLNWAGSPEKENIIMNRNNRYENIGNSRPAKLGGYWESLGGLAFIRFRDDGMYDVSGSTFPGGHGERETYRYTFNSQSFTLYFTSADYPSVEYRYTYFYTIEDQGNTLAVRTMMKETFENGVRTYSGPIEEFRIIMFRTDK